MSKRRVLLTILDGYGLSDKEEGNAVKLANTPNIDELCNKYPCTQLDAGGLAVGLPEGQMGNSEVGHLNIGAGRVVYQEYTRINRSIEDESFFKNDEFLKAAEHAKKNNSKLHIMGLVSPGGVHSAMNHLYALVDFAKQENIENFYVHAFMDGRDTPPHGGKNYLKEVEEKLSKENLPKVASVIGRYYAMDRDNRWERIEQAYNGLVLGEGERAEISYEGIQKSYDKDVTDEFIKPIIILEEGRIEDGDAVIFFNFRPDRARELTRAITFSDFDGFDRKKVINNIYYVCMTQYDETFPLAIAYPPGHLFHILTDVLDTNGLKQFRTAETEKYAHITFFFNGGVEKANPSETRCMIPSPKVATYDMQPEMSAYPVTDKVLEALYSPEYDFILVNFANPDMVGHTGDLKAAIKAVEAVDDCIGKIYKGVTDNDVTMILTADHGNCETMMEPDGSPHTAHTTDPVPLILVNPPEAFELKSGGKLADIAPTVLDIFNIVPPKEMDGRSLLLKKTDLVYNETAVQKSQ
jgi:2,3-bisphosphoglycerate-independent phosphoglycerate mutase